ncbi:hypothetical protein LX32DRAFT_169628 [Colletotrichum zoysiae]|uniref:Uncharacterized protein n=1 Tax=Colletotrichum zoysiae TaxID=1216348 RepID=A0AAD9HP69_9PEZI|nr:hypothetical protein LX32DRAFT_169628 [Colletotrichum zoysiae]
MHRVPPNSRNVELGCVHWVALLMGAHGPAVLSRQELLRTREVSKHASSSTSLLATPSVKLIDPPEQVSLAGLFSAKTLAKLAKLSMPKFTIPLVPHAQTDSSSQSLIA